MSVKDADQGHLVAIPEKQITEKWGNYEKQTSFPA